MTILTEDLNLPDGSGVEAAIEVQLWAPWIDSPTPGLHVPTGAMIVGAHSFSSDLDGVWSFNFLSNEEIQPAGTWWKIRRVIGCTESILFVSVPATGGPYNPYAVQVDPSDPSTWTGTGGNMALVKVFDGSSYQWVSGVEPTAPVPVIIFIGSADPQTTPGGRVQDNDIWLNLT